MKLNRLPGWEKNSWGYHGDDGGFFSSSLEGSWARKHGPKYKIGDTVGCGVDLVDGTIWFTHNGKKLSHTFSDVQGRLFPLLGLKDAIQLKTNFKGPFLWQATADNEELQGDDSD